MNNNEFMNAYVRIYCNEEISIEELKVVADYLIEMDKIDADDLNTGQYRVMLETVYEYSNKRGIVLCH